MQPDKPNPYVYDTDMPEAAVRDHFGKQMELLRELCAYGSNLLIRCYTQSGNQIEDLIILGALFRQFLVHLDATQVLLSKGCTHASLIHLRAMLEEDFYFHWLFQKETPLRAKHLYVWNLRKRRAWNRTTDPATQESKDFEALLAKEHADTLAKLRTPEMQHEAIHANKSIDQILAQPAFAKIDREFTSRRGTKPYDPEWYVPCGPASIRKLAAEVGMEVHYRMFYSKWSEMMHSSGFFEHVYTDDSGTSVEQIRGLEHFEEAIRSACTFTTDVFRLIIRRYRPGEETAYSTKYMTEWRDRFLNIPKVNINRKTNG